MEFSYKNPICTGVINNIRDPFIMLDNNRYYLTGTIPPYWDGKSEGVKLWVSDDLLNWEEIGFILRRDVADANSWFRDYWWAPEIHKKNGRYFLTVNCRNDELGVGQNPLIAVSDRIDGEYKLLNAESPLFTRQAYEAGESCCADGNDANIFTDDDGQSYISVCFDKGIFMYPFDLETATITGAPIETVHASENGWDTRNEGQFVMKRNGIYYCFWSSFTRSYEVGVAYAKDINGPWVKDERNPIITPIGINGLKHSGHNCIFIDRDGRYLTAYHITLADDNVQLLAIDPIYFEDDGRVITPAPTLSKMTI